MASHQLSANAAQADAASADAIAATSADDAASSADAIAATLTAAKPATSRPSPPQKTTLRAVDAYGSNALHWAAGRGHLALVRHLVEERRMDASAPAHPPRRRDAPTTRGRTALHYAARNGHLDVVEYLVKRPGVDADARAEGGVSPAQLACWRNEFAVVERLVAAGVDVAQKNDAGCGFAHWLACAPRDAGDLRPLAAWLAARLGPAALAVEPNGHGHTCLHKAAFAGHFDLCAYLVSCFFRGVLFVPSCWSRRHRAHVHVASTACLLCTCSSSASNGDASPRRCRLDAVDASVLNASPRVQRTGAT